MSGVIGVKDAVLGNVYLFLFQELYFVVNATGCGLAPFESFLLMRGVKTLALRMDKQQASAIKIAHWLESKNFKVLYPGLKSHPQYTIFSSQSRGAGAVLSFLTDSVEKSKKITNGMNLFSISVSFGCVNSLISMPCLMSHASIPEHVRRERQLPEDLIRLCIGIEDVEDLLEDLDRSITLAEK